VLIARRISVSNLDGNEETTAGGRHKTQEQVLILFSAGQQKIPARAGNQVRVIVRPFTVQIVPGGNFARARK
jgi:hypothetical protein